VKGTEDGESARLAQRQLDASNAQDADAFAACYAADVRLLRLPGGECFAEGREALRALYADLFLREPGRRADLLARIECGRFCVDHERVVSGPGAEPRFAVAIYEVEGGLIRRAWFPPAAY
jgi:uncharacterized protein (TIGR02246 family)